MIQKFHQGIGKYCSYTAMNVNFEMEVVDGFALCPP